MTTANNVADWFLSRIDGNRGDTISPLKIQKLIYYAQAWHFTLFNAPIFEENFEAWQHGPVVRSVFDRFRHIPIYNSINLSEEKVEETKFDEETIELLEDILTIYGEHNAAYLEDLTHSEDPWIIARGDTPSVGRCENVITLETMKKYYSKILNGHKSS